MIRAVLFDFDETLVNSLETFWHAFNRGVTRIGLPPATRAAVAGGLSRGTDLRNMVATIYPEIDATTVRKASRVCCPTKRRCCSKSSLASIRRDSASRVRDETSPPV